MLGDEKTLGTNAPGVGFLSPLWAPLDHGGAASLPGGGRLVSCCPLPIVQ